MVEEPPSSSKTRDGRDSEFEELWSELHSLKKLYAILQKNSVNTPNGDNPLETLDEKSRLLLKKLLDSATHQVLQSQTKIVFSSPSDTPASEPKTSIEDGVQQKTITPEKLQECPPAPAHKDQGKHTCLEVGSGPSQPKTAKSGRLPLAKPQISEKTCPLLELKRQTSIKSNRSSNEKSHRHTDHDHNRDRWSSKLRPASTKSIVHVPPNHIVNPTIQTKTRQVDGGDLLAVVPVPAQKRARVEAKATSQTCISGRVDRELTHSKRAELVTGRVRKPVSRIGSLNNRTATKVTKSAAKIDQGKDRTDRMKKNSSRETSGCASNKDRIIVQPRKLPPICTKNYELACQTSSSSSGARHTVSRIGSLNNRTATKSTAKIDREDQTDRMKKNASGETSSHASNKDRIIQHPRKHPPIRTKSYESTSRTTSSSSGSYIASLPRRLPARAGPTRRQPLRTKARKAEVEEKKEGKLSRFKNKLAIIFHHHHHHHHHIHDGSADGRILDVNTGGPQKHRSPWTYLRGILHQKSDGARAKHAKAVTRAPARQGQIGYFHALLEGLARNVWGKRRKKLAGNRPKKLHWWQGFRRRGGVRVANGKKPRLRIGFSRMNSQTTRKKLG